MGHRLSKIYTRTGDSGETGLGDGSRVAKDAPRVHAIGDLDELNSTIGMVLAQPTATPLRAVLEQVQHDLFDLGGELSMPAERFIDDAYVRRLEQHLDTFNADLPPLKEFILPGGGPAAAACHLARAVSRRAERSLLALARAEAVNPEALAYLNRLSDLLFVAARVLARAESGTEVLWDHDRHRQPPPGDGAGV